MTGKQIVALFCLVILVTASVSVGTANLFLMWIGKPYMSQFANISQRQAAMERLMNLSRIASVDITAYSPTKRETDGDPWVNAAMRTPKAGDVAVSRDLYKEGWVLGKKIFVECTDVSEARMGQCGIFEIADVMNSRWTKRIDIFFPSTKRAWHHGVKYNRVVALLEL